MGPAFPPCHDVAALVRYGLLRAEARGVAWAPNVRVQPEPVILEAASADDLLVLHSPAVGNTVRLGILGQVVWLSLQQRPQSLAQLVDALETDGARLEPLIRDAVRDLIELVFLHIAAPGPAITQDTSRAALQPA